MNPKPFLYLPDLQLGFFKSCPMKIPVSVLYLLLLILQACSFFKKNQTDRQSFEEMQAGNVSGVSRVTGIPYNDSTIDNSMMVAQYYEMPNAPNMVFIEGGSFVMGVTEEDVLNLSHNRLTRVTVPSFFMDRTEIANIHWLEFMNFYYHNRDSIPAGMTFEEFAEEILLPDTTVWAMEVAANDSYVKNYLRHPGFRMYPVVGVNWIQAQEFCKWRTKMVNHYVQEKQGYYTGVKLDNKLTVGEFKKPKKEKDTTRIEYPNYRLPTEAEWEYAAKAAVAVQYDNDRLAGKERLYPWDTRQLRNPYNPNKGLFLANFKRGRGDYAGIAGRQNDGAMLTAPIYSYPPNDFGLYNMAGNVNEWVEDSYFIDEWEDFLDLRQAKRALVYMDSTYQNKLTFNVMLYGRSDTSLKAKGLKIKKQQNDTIEVAKENLMPFPHAMSQNLLGLSGSVISKERLAHFKVYKGGSWKDVAYWLIPGTRRFLEMNKSLATLGFRCAMDYAPKKEKPKDNTITSDVDLEPAIRKRLAKQEALRQRELKKQQKLKEKQQKKTQRKVPLQEQEENPTLEE